MAQAQSPQDRDGDPLAQMMSTGDGRGAKREGRFHRAVSRLIKPQEPLTPETEQGHPVQHPVHPHSQTPGRTPNREHGQGRDEVAADGSSDKEVPQGDAGAGPPAAGAVPESGPSAGALPEAAETGYRPASRASVPNPYTARRVEVAEADTGAIPVGQWRGVGLDEPEPRSQHHLASTDTMTDTYSSSSEHPERPSTAEPSAPDPVAPSPPAEPRATGHPSGPSAPSVGEQAQPGANPYDIPAEAPSANGPPPAGGTGPQAPVSSTAPPLDTRSEPPPPWQQGGSGAAQPGQPTGAPQQHPGYQSAAGPEQYGPAPGGQGGPYQGPQYPAAQFPGPQQPGYPHPGTGHPGPPHAGPQYPAPQYPQPQYPGAGQHGGHPYPQASGYPPPVQGGYPPQPPQPYGGYPAYPQTDYPQHPPAAPAHPAQPYPVPYPQPQPVMPYHSPYPAPFQPPGYMMQGQPVLYPGHQPGAYGQPVQHVIVFTPGQQPQVITADTASTLFAERADSTSTDGVAENKALTRAEPRPSNEPDEEAQATNGPGQEAEDRPEPQLTGHEAADESVTGAAGPFAGSTAQGEELKAAAAELAAAKAAGAGSQLLSEALAGLAMRDLSLVDALLEMVEQLETDAQDPDLLDKLFQIDNFATRMRRNGENVLVLTGHEGGESDAHDEIVPLLDVARAATSEIKDYPRVRLGKLPQRSITGMAADDVSHLLAELLDNATANSPEHSQVVISAQELDDGRLMLVVEDEGVGIPENQLAELNERLVGDPVLDEEVPRHMGLYVASRIANKHGLETRLEPRSFRGVNAYAIIPKELLRVATPRSPGQSRTSTAPPAPDASADSAAQQPASHGNAGGGSTAGNSSSSSSGTAGPRTGRSTAKAAPPPGGKGDSTVTAAGLPRRSATPHSSPLRMVQRPDSSGTNPPKGRDDTPAKLTGEARAEQIRDELGDFFDGERAALEGKEIEEDGQ